MKTSNAGTKYMLTLATAHLANLKASLVKVQNATELTVSYNFGKGRYEGKHFVYDQKSVVVPKGAKHPSRYGEPGETEDGVVVDTKEDCKRYDQKVFVFEEVQASRISKLETEIAAMESEVEFLTMKIAEFKEV